MGIQASRLRDSLLAFALAIFATAGLAVRPVAAFCYEGFSKWATGYASPTPRVQLEPISIAAERHVPVGD